MLATMTPAEFHAAFLRLLQTRLATAADINALTDYLLEQGQERPWQLERLADRSRRVILLAVMRHLQQHDQSYWRLIVNYDESIQWHTIRFSRRYLLQVHLLLVQVENLGD